MELGFLFRFRVDSQLAREKGSTMSTDSHGKCFRSLCSGPIRFGLAKMLWPGKNGKKLVLGISIDQRRVSTDLKLYFLSIIFRSMIEWSDHVFSIDRKLGRSKAKKITFYSGIFKDRSTVFLTIFFAIGSINDRYRSFFRSDLKYEPSENGRSWTDDRRSCANTKKYYPL